MKKTVLAIGLSLMTLAAVAQKKEIRKASRAVDSGDFTAALSELNTIENQIEGEKEDLKAEFYYLKGKALYSSAPANLDKVKEAVSNLKKAGSLNAKSTTSSEIAELTSQIVEDLVASAIEDQNASKNISAADKLMEVYKLDEANNQQYLYYAASNYHNGKELDKALNGYRKLLDQGYTGVQTQYFAQDVETGDNVLFQDENQREIMIKAGAYSNPTEEVSEDVTPQILQYMAYIYIQKEEYEKAIGVVDDALKTDPENTVLLRAKADVTYQLGNKEEYKKLMKQIVSLDPNNPELLFNLGVSSAELGEQEEALSYYKQTIKADPTHYAANLNAAVLILSFDEDIVSKMNELGMTPADNKKYEELQKERKALMKTAVPYLENALQINDEDIEVKRTLANVYSQIGEEEKSDKLMQEIQN